MKLNNTLFVLDTETGGLDPNSASLMEIAGVVIRDGKILHTYSEIVKSKTGKYNCNDFARKMHGITDEMANEKGKLPIEIMQDLKNIRDKFFDGNPMTIVAHNAAFDISFVKNMFAKNGEELSSVDNGSELNYDKIFSRNALDTATMALVLRLQGRLPFDRCSLDNILAYYNISCPVGERHSALSDAKQTAIAFKKMFDDLSHKKEITTQVETNKVYDLDFDDEKKLNNNGGCDRSL